MITLNENHIDHMSLYHLQIYFDVFIANFVWKFIMGYMDNQFFSGTVFQYLTISKYRAVKSTIYIILQIRVVIGISVWILFGIRRKRVNV